jgi:hypothetical protein
MGSSFSAAVMGCVDTSFPWLSIVPVSVRQKIEEQNGAKLAIDAGIIKESRG